MDEYITKKYGVNGGEQIHHYETLETFDQDDNLVLPGGLKVPSTFVYTYRASADSNAFLTSFLWLLRTMSTREDSTMRSLPSMFSRTSTSTTMFVK